MQGRVMKIKGVKSTITTVILSRYKEIMLKETKNDKGHTLKLTGEEKHV